MKKYLIIISVLIFVSLLALIFLNKAKGEDYFNQVQLSDNNLITNTTLPSYYDTILSVGLDQHDIKGVHVVISELSDVSKNNFGGELKASLRYHNGSFYLFIDELKRKEAITVISHEIIHMEQYLTENFIFDGNNTFWFGQEYDYKNLDYEERPWEKDAFERESLLSSEVYEILIGN